MVKKANNTNLQINTATVKAQPKTVINLSRIIPISVEFNIGNRQETVVLPPRENYTLPENAILITKNENLKVL